MKLGELALRALLVAAALGAAAGPAVAQSDAETVKPESVRPEAEGVAPGAEGSAPEAEGPAPETVAPDATPEAEAGAPEAEADAEADAADETISGAALVTLSGLDTLIASIRPQIEAQADTIGVDAAQAEAFKVAAEAYAAESMLAAAADALERATPEADRPAIKRFLTSELGARIVALERASSSPDAQAEMIREAGAILEALTEQPERAALYRDFVDTLDMELINRRVLEIMTRATLSGLLRRQGEGAAPDTALVESLLKQQLAPAFAQMDQLTLLSVAHTYRDLSDDAFAAYLEWLREGPGNRFAQASIAAFLIALEDAGARFEKLMGETATRREL